MPGLRELQEAVVDALCADDPRRAASHVTASGFDEAAARLDVYRNNVREGFLSALEAGFPVVARLGGTEWFRQTGLAYMKMHPSRSGDLRLVGEHFAAYLSSVLKSTRYEYFADVARLCWAYQQVLDARDAQPLDPASIAGVAADRYGELLFEQHPAARVVASPYPILAIWRANQPEILEPPIIRLDAGASRVLVLRRPDHVELRELSAIEHLLLEGFAAGTHLGALVERAGSDGRADGIPDALRVLARAGVFAGVRIRNHHWEARS